MPKPTSIAALQRAAQRFLDLNLAGNLLLPNAWDDVSARVFENAGFPALGTTSAGVAWSRGVRDAEQISREAMCREIASIAAAVQCPVTADIEAGYGPSPADVAATVEAVLDAGAVGVNLEDAARDYGDASLFGVAEQAARVAAAREAADRKGVHLVINARTDTFLLRLGADLEERVAMTIERGNAYLRAGADIVFVPYLLDTSLMRRVTRELHGPLSVMATADAPPAAALFTAGAKRVSIGPLAILATLGLLRAIAAQLRQSGDWQIMAQHCTTFSDVEALLDR